MRRLQRKLAVMGTSLFAATMAIIPLSASAAVNSAASTVGDNAAVNVQTEYDCRSHTLTAEVTNKLSTDITPNVTFDNKKPLFPNDTPISPAATGYYQYGFSGSYQKPTVSVAVDGYSNVEVHPSLNCQEPVSFLVTEASEHTVVGYLTNNNFNYPQVVMLGTVLGEQQTVTLEPGESSLVSIPYTSFPGQTSVTVSVTNGPDYQSTYTVDLT